MIKLRFCMAAAIHTFCKPNAPHATTRMYITLLRGSTEYELELLLANPQATSRYLAQLRHHEAETESVLAVFRGSLDMASGQYAADAYKMLKALWKLVFATNSPYKSLQPELLKSRSKLTHIMMNRMDFAAYMDIIDTKSWTDLLANTLELRVREGVVSFNSQATRSFVLGPASERQKNVLISTFVRKLLLHGRPKNFEFVVSTFIDLLLLRNTEPDGFFDRLLRLIAVSQDPDHVQKIQEVLLRKGVDEQFASDFLSALLRSVVYSNPRIALAFWKGKAQSGTLTSEDLKNCMLALYNERLYEQTLSLYAKHPELHHDNQIEILLRISRSGKDWKLMQKQFEEMYGRGDLPHELHYAIVMDALVSINATNEAEELYAQLLRRRLKPSASIFASLIKSKVMKHDLAAAEKRRAEFLSLVSEGALPAEAVPRINALMFESFFTTGDLSGAMEKLRVLVEEQVKGTDVLLDSKLFNDLMNLATNTFAVKEFDELLELAQKLNINDEEFHHRCIIAMSKLERFEQAETLCYEAHHQSPVPYLSARINLAQFRNYRLWFKTSTNRLMRGYIVGRMGAIISRLDAGEISVRDIDSLLVEVIASYVTYDVKQAHKYLEKAIMMNVAREAHFAPLLKHYSTLGTYDGYSHILDLYKEMAKLRVRLSARTYVHLMRSLVHTDKMNKTGFANSFKLLESVFELYGFSTMRHVIPRVTSDEDVFKNGADLVRLVAVYVGAVGEEGMDLLVHFLNQMQTRLEKKVTFGLRFVILKEMARLYLKHGNVAMSRTLTENALSELHGVIGNYRAAEPGPLPRLLQLEYRKLIDVKLQQLGHYQSGPEEYVTLLRHTIEHGVRLLGPQYSELTRRILAVRANVDVLGLLLLACEEHLVSGNWIELKIERKVHYIYKLVLENLSGVLPALTLATRYAVLNDFYGVDAHALGRSTNDAELRRELEAYNKICLELWTVGQLLRHIPEFFVPERALPTSNIIEPSMAKLLFAAVARCSRREAFGLYDEYPETMEYLLFYGEARRRHTRFRRQMRMKGAVASDRALRRAQAVSALDDLRIGEELPSRTRDLSMHT